jgi:hypothetical protein
MGRRPSTRHRGRIIAAQKWIPSVGRVEFRNHDMAWGGTGCVIAVRDGAHIVATNRHVAKKVARRKADGRAVFMRTPNGVPYGAAVDFAEEVGSAEDNASTAEVAGLEYLADDLSPTSRCCASRRRASRSRTRSSSPTRRPRRAISSR